MTRSSTESKTSLAIAANLSELELQKILIDKMESNKSIYRSDEQKNLYKALFNAYEVTSSYLTLMEILFRSKDVEMMRIKMKNPPLDQAGGQREDELEKEPESTSAPKEKHPRHLESQHKTAGESAQTEEPMHTTKDLEELAH
ncbi:hypothetical protein Tco_0644487 [Tanacetum coccineum]